MTRKERLSKGAHRQRLGSDLSFGRLAQELRHQWREEHPDSVDDTVPVGTIRHIERARQYPLHESIDPSSLMAVSFFRYLDIRATITNNSARNLGFESPSEATEHLVCEELIAPDMETAPIRDVVAVRSGISIAKLALNRTMLHQ